MKEVEELSQDTKFCLGKEDQSRVTRAIRDCRRAFDGLAELVESPRKNIAEAGTVHIVRRFGWIISKTDTARSRLHRLEISQRSL